jgi:hypothetical protein
LFEGARRDEVMNTNAKLSVVAGGLCLAAIGLVVGLRTRGGEEANHLAPVRPPPVAATPAEREEHAKAMDQFRRKAEDDHDRMLKMLLDDLDRPSGDFCEKSRQGLRAAMDLYAFNRFTDIDIGVTQDLMSDEGLSEVWDGPRDRNAVGQVNFRLSHGFLLKQDVANWRVDYMKIFSFPDNVTPACSGPIPQDK